MIIEKMRCEHQENPIGIGRRNPLFHYLPDGAQQGCRLIVSSGRKQAESGIGDCFDSGYVPSDRLDGVEYAGLPLKLKSRYFWRVRVTDAGGTAHWSPVAFFETGIMDPALWQAEWIGAHTPGFADREPEFHDKVGSACPVFTRAFDVKPSVRLARLYITAKGLYHATINGEEVTRDLYTPGWSDYAVRLYHQSYDVTALLKEGGNRLDITLADGWFAGNIGAFKRENYGGYPLRVIAQLEIHCDDGCRIIGTDEAFEAHVSPIRFADLIMGECHDLTAPYPGEWVPTLICKDDKSIIQPQAGPPVRVMGSLRPVSVARNKRGHYIIDMGQNMVGRARLRFSSPNAEKIKIQYGEMTYDDDTLYTENLRTALQTDIVCKPAGKAVFEPMFTYHGFRYMEIQGYSGSFSEDSIDGLVIHSDTPQTGGFSCSNEAINRLYQNIVWSQRGNFFSVPTDCPQRDERLGWTGDAQIFARTASFNMDVEGFFEKWLIDMADAQEPNGAFHDIAPRFDDFGSGVAAWADAGVIIPWQLYRCYGNTRILRDQYPSICRYIAFLDKDQENGYRKGSGYGDWLNVEETTPIDIISTAYYAYSCKLASQIARVLERDQDARRFERSCRCARRAFNRCFVREDGRIESDTQTAYLLALHMELLDEERRCGAAAHLVRNIIRHGNHLTTGFIGVGYLLPILCDYGYTELAYTMIQTTSYPSWLYSVLNGATTMWERWNSYTLESGFGNVAMNSFNHYSLGSVGEWLFRYAAGIDLLPGESFSGYKGVRIAPRFDPSLTFAGGWYDTPYGRVSTGWRYENDRIHLVFQLPPAAAGQLVIPDGYEVVEASEHIELTKQPYHGGFVLCGRIGPGAYSMQLKPAAQAKRLEVG